MRLRTLATSRSGRRQIVLELHLGADGELEAAYEVSGYLKPEAAERRLWELEDRWLAPECRAQMDGGRELSVRELRWEEGSE